MTDAGLGIVEHLRVALDPEREHIAELPRGFAWWPGHAPQQVRAEEPHARSGVWFARVHVELALALRVEGSGAVFAALSKWNAARHGLSAARWDAETGLVSLHASVTAEPADELRAAQRLSHAALLQVSEGFAAGALVESLGGEPPAAAAPGAEPRAAPSPLGDAWHAYAQRGAEASPFDEALLARVMSAEPAPWTRLQATPGGFHAELPATAPGDPEPGRTPGAGTALLRVQSAQPHPRLGAGLLILLAAPVEAEPVAARVSATAALLNEAEAREWTGLDQLGGWCVHPDAGLVHATFLPALAAQDALLERLVWQSAARARWMRGFLARVAALRPTPGS